jgi:DNA-binding MarR family transcriptional regulator
MKTKAYATMSNFMQLLESIANGKTKVLDFGDGMVFFRGEIHIIKAIGDRPGLSISEIARSFNVTRAVVSKIVLKLERNGYVRKETDPEDRKRVQVYLTERGQAAFDAHDKFHLINDRQIYEYLEGLNETELEAVLGFVRKAQHMIHNHF